MAGLAAVAVGALACRGGVDDAGTPTPMRRDPLARRDVAPQPTLGPDFRLISVASRDAIEAIDQPAYWTAERAEESYDAGERVIGVAIGDAARAYSVPLLSRHEIVNDTLGGAPIAVTW